MMYYPLVYQITVKYLTLDLPKVDDTPKTYCTEGDSAAQF